MILAKDLRRARMAMSCVLVIPEAVPHGTVASGLPPSHTLVERLQSYVRVTDELVHPRTEYT